MGSARAGIHPVLNSGGRNQQEYLFTPTAKRPRERTVVVIAYTISGLRILKLLLFYFWKLRANRDKMQAHQAKDQRFWCTWRRTVPIRLRALHRPTPPAPARAEPGANRPCPRVARYVCSGVRDLWWGPNSSLPSQRSTIFVHVAPNHAHYAL